MYRLTFTEKENRGDGTNFDEGIREQGGGPYDLGKLQYSWASVSSFIKQE